MSHIKRSSRRVPDLEAIHLEEIRRLRSMGCDLSRLGYNPFTVRFSKLLSSKRFFKT